MAAIPAAVLMRCWPAACSGAGDTAHASEPGRLDDGSPGTGEVPAGEDVVGVIGPSGATAAVAAAPG